MEPLSVLQMMHGASFLLKLQEGPFGYILPGPILFGIFFIPCFGSKHIQACNNLRPNWFSSSIHSTHHWLSCGSGKPKNCEVIIIHHRALYCTCLSSHNFYSPPCAPFLAWLTLQPTSSTKTT